MFNRIEKDLISSLTKNVKVYSSIDIFTSDYAKVEDVTLDNYIKIFIYFLVLLLINFAAFLLNHLYLYSFKKNNLFSF